MAKAWPTIVRDIPAAWLPPAKATRVVATTAGSARMYSGARNTNLTGGFGSSGNSSADAELSLSLAPLRSRSRQLMRDSPYAKRARAIVVNNVIGAGIGLQAQVKNTRGEFNARVNAAIEREFACWSKPKFCHTGGALHFSDIERMVMSEVFTAGEAFVRLHPRAFGESKIPFALELIEPERMCDDTLTPPTASARMGVEMDTFGRAIAYWIRETHPGDIRVLPEQRQRLVRVPAEQMVHVRIIDRWPQTRGEPWLHAVLRKLNDMEEYSGSELLAARMSANIFGTISTPEADNPPGVTTTESGQREIVMEPGTISQLTPGEQFDYHAPNRPNTALDPFMRYMLREVAAGSGVSYESLSRDYAQSNYSSSRQGILDDRDLWKILQAWVARSFRAHVHQAWLQQAVLSRAIPEISVESYALNTEQYQATRWKFRGWSWVDPTTEVEAYKEAVKGGFMTVSQVVAQTGGGVDIEDVIAERERELEMFEEAEIEVDTTVHAAPAPAAAQPAAPAPAADPETPDNPDAAPTPARVVSIAR